MDLDDVIDHVSTLVAVLVLRPRAGDGSPEISWGDAFVYYAPDGRVPATQPFATIVTKDYPDETPSGLDEPGTYRLNIAVSSEFERVIGSSPRDAARTEHDTRVRDVWFPPPGLRCGGLGVGRQSRHRTIRSTPPARCGPPCRT